jgi:nucleoside-diphosphate-sugar epimerase
MIVLLSKRSVSPVLLFLSFDHVQMEEKMKTVAITGAEGNIGTRLRNNLAGKYELRLISLKPIAGEEAFVVNIADGVETLIPAFKGVDSVVHLAASPAVDTPWDSVLHNNIIGTYNVFEAARQAGVKQLIFASSNHAVGTYEQEFEPGPDRPNDKVIDELVPIRPDSLYGVSKVFGEALGRYYADHLGMHVISLRIGWITPANRPKGSNLAEPGVTMWQSHEDFAQMVEKCLEADDIQFDIFYGISDNPFHFFDIEHARQEIGYEPQDSSLEKMHEATNKKQGAAVEEG